MHKTEPYDMALLYWAYMMQASFISVLCARARAGERGAHAAY